MNSKARIESIKSATVLEFENQAFEIFDLSELELPQEVTFDLPNNLRLGHIAEKTACGLIKACANFDVLHENIQIKKEKTTIGEIDFILKHLESQQCIHLEFAYKFYLFDPSHSKNNIDNWIGPNRNDSLKDKLEKLKTKQFPLLYRPETSAASSEINVEEVQQKLCLLASLFVPFGCTETFSPNFLKAIKGYYVNFKKFLEFDDPAKAYYLPSKKEWGIAPSENKNWNDFATTAKEVNKFLEEKQAPLCWQKHHDTYTSFFIVWW